MNQLMEVIAGPIFHLGLPNIPTMCVVQNKDNTQDNELYVGTDVGVYQKIDVIIGNLTHLDYQMWWLQSWKFIMMR